MGSDLPYTSIDFTETFLVSFTAKDFSAADRRALLKALRLLDDNDRHPSLRVHALKGDREGSWSISISVSASDSLRMTFERLPDGRRRMLTCRKHDDR